MSTQRNRPTRPIGSTSKPLPSAKRTTSQPSAAAKASTPASKTPSQPLATTMGSRLGMPKTSVSTSTTARAGSTRAAAYAPASRTATLAASGTAARVVRAFTSGFPFAGLEYVIFLGVIEFSVRLALPVGLILLGLACGIFFLQQQATLRQDATESNLLATLRQWLGEPLALAGSLALLGAGLLAFTRWAATGTRAFSVLAIIALVAAMLLIFVASYRRDAQPA